MARRASDPPSGSGTGRAILCAVLDAAALGAQPSAQARALFEAGVDWIQLRDRTVPASTLWRLTRALVEARDAVLGSSRSSRPRTPPPRTPPWDCRPRVLVNRRVDVARAAGADGVHLGFDAVPPREARALLAADALLGVSLHSVEEIREAAVFCAYAHLAPVWSPRSKPASRPALGIEALARATRLGMPLLAQGGIDPERAVAALRAGAFGVAVTGALADPPSAPAEAAQLRRVLDDVSSAERSPTDP